MAGLGSRKWLKYDTDDGSQWAMFGDESNIENIVVTDANVDIAIADVDDRKWAVPQNVEPRFATFQSTTTVAKRKIRIPTPAIYQALAANDTAIALRTFSEDGETFQLQSLTPERIRPIVTDADTGLNDGDA